MKKINATFEGKAIEVEVDDAVILPDEAGSFVKKEFMESEITRRLAKARNGLAKPEDLLTDDEFRAQAIKAWGINEKKQLADEDIAKIRKNLEDTLLTPVKTENEKLKQSLTQMHKKDLHLQILQAAQEAGVLEHWVKAPAEGLAPPIINMVESYFGQSDDHGGNWFLKDGETFAYAKNPSKDRPYKTVAEFLPEFVANPKNAPIFIGDKRQRVGPTNGSRPTNNGPSGTTVLHSNDPLSFGQNLEALAKGTMRVAPSGA